MKKFRFLAIVLFLSGIVYHFALLSYAQEDKWNVELEKYNHIQQIISQNYPEKVNLPELTYKSIHGLLKSLDPHSYFLDPVALRSLFEDQKGNYYGIGIRITKYDNQLTVVAPMENTPAYRIGILPGDIITHINNIPTDKYTLIVAMKKMRGKKDTSVLIRVYRKATEESLTFKVKRVKIPLNTITAAFLLPQAPSVGYISLKTFGRTTYSELVEKLRRLKKGGMKGLVLDLRNNTGGSLYASIKISDLFLSKGKIIVSIRGRKHNRVYLAQDNNQYENLPLAVLINRSSASASEILAAAFQDNKRAKIIGVRSFGKGLVETVYDLPFQSAMALTTAKYYTPDNKCLQRDYSNIDEYYDNGHFDDASYDINQNIKGGVMPDIYVKGATYSAFVSRLINKGIFFRFSRRLIDSKREIKRDFRVTDELYKNFISFLNEKKIRYTASDLKLNADSIKYEIKRDLMSNKFDLEEGIKVFLSEDLSTREAIKYMVEKIQ